MQLQTNCKRKSLTTIDDRCYFYYCNQAKFDVMSKTIKSVLLLCFILSGAISHAHGAARTEKENEEGVPISIILKTQHGGTDKSGSIVSSIDGHYLTVVFTENLGQVAIEITTSTGGYVQVDSCMTPNGLQFYIPNTGDYIVNFTLPNGDEYYGEFTVTD